MDVLVAGDQMGVLSGACSRFELVSRQHPDLHRNQRVTCSEDRVGFSEDAPMFEEEFHSNLQIHETKCFYNTS